MRVNYFAYYLRDKATDSAHLIDLTGFLSAFAEFDDKPFKGNFLHADENLYLLKHIDNTYLLVMTRNNDLIKRVNTTDMSVKDISEILAEDESIGFASYILFRDGYFGIGTTYMAPKADVFASFVNKIFDKIKLSGYTFIIEPVLKQATREEVMNMPFIGKATIALSKENGLAGQFLEMISAKPEDTFDLDAIEVIIRPMKKKNTKNVVCKLIEAAGEDGMEKLIVKAKEDMGSRLMDLYITGKGPITDSVSITKPAKVADYMVERCQNNKYLHSQLQELRNNARFTKKTLKMVTELADAAAWPAAVAGLQLPN